MSISSMESLELMQNIDALDLTIVNPRKTLAIDDKEGNPKEEK